MTTTLKLVAPVAPLTDPVDYALAYARLGLKVFPQHTVKAGRCTCERGTACEDGGKHPLHMMWQDEATTDEFRIRNIWKKDPGANVAILLGRPSGVFEFEGDAARGGLATLDEFERKHGPLPRTPTQRSGSGGRKFLFRYPDLVVPHKTEIPGGIEILGDRHATTLPPSRNANGTYEWLPGLAPWETPIAPATAWLLSMIPQGGEDLGEHPQWAEAVLEAHFERVVRCNDGWTVRCAAPERHTHGDANPSLWVFLTKSGALSLYCRTQQCHEAPPVGLGRAELFHRAGVSKAERRAPKPMNGEKAPREEKSDGRPKIRLTTELHEIGDAAIKALAGDPGAGLYVHGRRLARIVRQGSGAGSGVERPRGVPVIATVLPETMQELLSKAAQFTRWDERKESEVRAIAPITVARAVIAREQWTGIPELEAVSESPVLRPDGTVHRAEGYDPATRVLHLPSYESPPVAVDLASKVRIEVADNSWLEIVEAVVEIMVAFSAYRFADREADRAALLAMLLTPIARPAINGPVPMFPVTSPTPRSGKGKLATACAIIATGREPAIMTGARRGDEWDKTLLSVALEGDPILLLDNLEGTLRSPELSAALTSRRYRSRLLGQSKIVEAPWNTVVYATGNNLSFGGDLAFRTVPVSIDTGAERPDLIEFKFDPVDLARRERPRLHALALGLLEAHARAGRKSHGKVPLGGFEEWDRVVRGCVIACGLGDPLAGRERVIREADADLDFLREFVAACRGAFGSEDFTVSRAVRRAQQDGEDELRAVLAGTNFKGDGARIDSRKVGAFLKRYRNRPIDGRRIEAAGKEHSATLWKVAEVGDDPTRTTEAQS